jgi:septum formation protein
MLGIPFTVFRPGIDETGPYDDPERAVRELARRKAEAAGDGEGRPILAADTAVVVDGAVLGKPRSEAEAEAMLRRLSGRWHRVLTGVAVVAFSSGRSAAGVETTRVRFRDLDESEIRDYILSGEPFDKAGAYGIQGRASAMVERIEGCYFNVVGLPVVRSLALLREVGYGYRYGGITRIG